MSSGWAMDGSFRRELKSTRTAGVLGEADITRGQCRLVLAVLLRQGQEQSQRDGAITG